MTSQLVMTLDGDSPTFKIEVNPRGLPSLKFDRPDEGCFIPRLGSQDLVRFAVFCRAVGMRVESFKVTYSNLNRLDGDVEVDISQRLVSALDREAFALSLLDGELRDYVVIGVKFLDEKLNAATLYRHGLMEAEPGIDVTEILSSAWNDLGLS